MIDGDVLNASTVRNILQVAKLFFAWTSEHDIWPNIANRIKKPKLSPGYRKDYLSLEQYTFVVENTSDLRTLCFIQICVGCGLRVCEISRLRMGDIEPNFDYTVLRVRGKGKDDRERAVVLSGRVKSNFENYLKIRSELPKTTKKKCRKPTRFCFKKPKFCLKRVVFRPRFSQ
jgi:integrase